MAALEREIRTYNEKLPELLANAGKFVLIKDDQVGVYEAYADALKAAYQQYRPGEFLVKRIAPAEQVASFTRDHRFECRT